MFDCSTVTWNTDIHNNVISWLRSYICVPGNKYTILTYITCSDIDWQCRQRLNTDQNLTLNDSNLQYNIHLMYFKCVCVLYICLVSNVIQNRTSRDVLMCAVFSNIKTALMLSTIFWIIANKLCKRWTSKNVNYNRINLKVTIDFIKCLLFDYRNYFFY